MPFFVAILCVFVACVPELGWITNTARISGNGFTARCSYCDGNVGQLLSLLGDIGLFDGAAGTRPQHTVRTGTKFKRTHRYVYCWLPYYCRTPAV